MILKATYRKILVYEPVLVEIHIISIKKMFQIIIKNEN